ncbi:hypothetical protein BDW60DRAFT_196758 [Aspergillus nidulans var. acristatus]
MYTYKHMSMLVRLTTIDPVIFSTVGSVEILFLVHYVLYTALPSIRDRSGEYTASQNGQLPY